MLFLLSRWMVTSWSACTRSCGGGVQTRRVTCQKLKASGISVPVPNDMCTQLSKRPVDTQACNQQLCVEWAFSNWGQVRSQRGFYLQMKSNIIDSSTIGRKMPPPPPWRLFTSVDLLILSSKKVYYYSLTYLSHHYTFPFGSLAPKGISSDFRMSSAFHRPFFRLILEWEEGLTSSDPTIYAGGLKHDEELEQ